MRINIKRKQKRSGYAVTFMGTISNIHEYKKVEWDNKHIKDLKQCKNNINKGKGSHYGSKVFYASFGNKGFYGRVGSSSVSLYTSKTSKNELTRATINNKVHMIEEM